MREADSQRSKLAAMQQFQRRRICQLDDEITEVKNDLRTINLQEPQYFFNRRPTSTRPATNRSDSRGSRKSGGQRPITAPAAGRTVPLQAAKPCWGRSVQISSKPTFSRQNTACSVQSYTNEKETTPKRTGSKWKSGMTRTKIDVINMVTNKHVESKKRLKEQNPEFTLAELDKIKNINRWLSISKMSEQNKIPTLAMRYIHNQHRNWNFDLQTFLEKKFPPTNEKKDNVPDELMELQKKTFNNLTAAKALMKFKRRLENFRAKTDEERANEKMWEELKNVRYLRIPGVPIEPHTYSSDLF